MYKSFTAQEYLKFFNLPSDYKVDGVLLSGTWRREVEQEKVKKVLTELNEEIEFETLPHFLFNTLVFKINGKRFWFDAFYGGAILSEFLHLACLFGSKKNILVGVCGGLNKDANSGDLIAVESAYGDESSTRMYDPKAIDNEHFSDKILTESLIKKLKPKYNIKTGKLITCQAMLAETWEDIKMWSDQGYLGIDMESSTVFAVSNYFNVPAASLISVADNLIKEESVLHENFELMRELMDEVKLHQYRVAVAELISV